MLAVLLSVLSVLKIIGIVLLCILAFVLFLLILVLFVPVRYRLDALVPETDLDEGFDVEKTDIRAKFSWMLFVIRGGISFPKDKAFTLRVFGIRILPKKEKAKKEEKEKESDKAKEDGSAKTGASEDDGKKDSNADAAKKETGKTPSGGADKEASNADAAKAESYESPSGETDKEDSHADADDTASGAEGESEEEKEETSFLDVLWRIFDGIDNFLKTPLNVFEKIQYTISRVCDKIGMIKSTLENDIFKRAFELVKKKLIKIIRMILPDKCDVDVMFGSGDPATTAEILAAYSALYPILFKNVRFRPDFERKAVYADAHIKGHITLFTIVWSAAVCYFNKDVKKTIRRFKKIMES
jgi:hypothetical protein